MRDVAQWEASQPDVALIFEGKVVKQELRAGGIGGPANAMSMSATGRFRKVEFTIARVFRGAKQDHVSVSTGLGGGDCGYLFQTGETYLVYATGGPNGAFFTSICSGTQAIADAATAIRFLTGEQPTAEDLLSPTEYQKQYMERVLPRRTGSVCGQVLKPDGAPLKGANLELWELRDDDLPPRSADDPNTSTADGHFCIKYAEPGRYLLTAEDTDYDNNARYMSFYPGVYFRAQAIPIAISAGVQLSDVKLTTFYERLYTISLRVVTPDGTQLSYKNGSGVAVESIDRNPLAYHISHTLEADGSYTFGYIPSGTYVVTTYFQPDFEDGQQRPFPEASRWKPSRQEVTVHGNTEVVIHMEPAN